MKQNHAKFMILFSVD